ncbi:MAG: hypothetical protein NZ936_17915 [Alphaproteobacteria bacterium]|nr:hypothetical protein [Alphaproteobacteria bacterium]
MALQMKRDKRSAHFQRYVGAAALILAILALWFHDILLPAIQP